MNVFTYNVSPMDQWSGRQNDNVFKIDGLNAQQWVNAKDGRTFTEFYANRDLMIAQSYARVWSNMEPSSLPVENIYSFANTRYQSDMAQVIKTQSSWEKFAGIKANGGRAIGFDIESFGDVQGGKGIFGITEIGIGERLYSGGNVTSSGQSILIGIDNAQRDYLYGVVDKFKTDGWDMLSKQEKSDLKRVSMYSNATFTKYTDGQFKGLYGVMELGDVRINADAMYSGINRLHSIETKASDVLPRVMPWLTDAMKQSDTVGYAANSNFDIEGLANVLRQNNAPKSLVDDVLGMKNDTLDIIYALRAMAGSDHMSVDSYQKREFGIRASASVEEQMRARRMSGVHTHQAYQDTLDQGKILDDMVDEITRTLEPDKDGHILTRMEKINAEMHGQRASDMFLFHHGALNQTSGMEFASIQGRGVSSYSFTNEFWQINQEHSHYMDMGDGQQRYVLTMDNVADLRRGRQGTDVTSFTIVRDTEEEAMDFIRNNAHAYNPADFTDKQIYKQQDFKYKDFGRREFGKMISPAEVRMDGDTEIYGYESLKRHMDLEKALDGHVDLDSSKLSFRQKVDAVMDFINTNYDKDSMPLHGYYQVQAFIGMHDKLKNEKPLLDEITKRLNALDVDDLEKTALFNKSYTNAIELMDSRYKRKTPAVDGVISDAMGVDVNIDGQIKRINAYSAASAQSDINRIFNGMISNGTVDRNGILNVIDDLYSRNVFDDDSYARILNIARNVSTDGLYGLSVDIGDAINDSVMSMFDGRQGTIIGHFESQMSHQKNLESLAANIAQNGHISYTKGSFGKIYKSMEQDIQSVINDTIVHRPVVTNITDFTSNEFSREINSLVDWLNISKDGRTDKLIEEMFVVRNKQGSVVRKPYALSTYSRIQSFIVKPDDGNSAFLFMTREQDMGKFYSKLMSGEFDLSSRQGLIDSGVLDYAAFEELPKVNKYQLSDGVISTISQGKDFEKSIIPELRINDNSNGPMKAYFNSAEYDFFSQHRMVGSKAFAHIANGEYEAGTRVFRKSQNNYLREMSASASYRGIVMPDGSVRRVANFGPADYIRGHEVNVTKGLKAIFDKGVTSTPIDVENLTVAQRIVDSFANEMGFIQRNNERDLNDFYGRVIRSQEFEEFFMKRLYVGNLSDDINVNLSGINKNFYGVIQDMVAADVDNRIYDSSVAEALSRMKSSYYQVLNESAVQKGIVSTVRSGDYNDMSGLHSTLRPTYDQQNNGMYYTMKSIDMDLFDGLFDSTKSEISGIHFGTSVMTQREYADKLALKKAHYNPFGDPDFDIMGQERNFVARVKQMSNYDLQTKYRSMKHRTRLASELGLDADTYRAAVSYMEQELMSLHEDKIFIAPGLNEQELFQSRDTKKLTMNWDNMDTNETERILRSLADTEIKADTIIGIRADGTPVFHNGPTSLFTKQNLEDLLDESQGNMRITRVLPTVGDIVDNKIMMNGAEKATVHSMNIAKFAQTIGLSTTQNDLKTALKIANRLFGEMSDGSVAIANLHTSKHGVMFGSHTLWNTITTMYQDAGYGKEFVDYVNNNLINIDAAHPGVAAFEGFERFAVGQNGRILSNSTEAVNPSWAAEYLYDRMLNGDMLDKIAGNNTKLREKLAGLNSSIASEIEYMRENNIALTVMQRQSMNEHMGNRVIVDQRIDQAIRTRGIRPGGFGVQEVDEQWADDIQEFARSYNGKGTALAGTGNNALQKYVDAYSISRNASRIQNTANQTDIQKSVIGITESLMYFNDPNAVNVDGSNIVKVSLNDLIEEESRLKGGLSSQELQNSIFFVNGKPSEFLERLAEKWNVDLSKNSYSLYLDLDGNDISINKKTYKGLLIPIQSVFDDVDDKIFFQNTQGSTVRLINKVIEAVSNPSVATSKETTVSNLVAKAYSEFNDNMREQLRLLNKDSDAYKAFNQYVMPTSQQVLAQDEVAPLVGKMMGSDFKKLMEQQADLEADILANPNDMDAIQKYQAVSDEIKQYVDEIADNIKNDDTYYTKFINGGSNKRLIEAGTFMDGGKKHYGLAVAMGEDAIERMGFNFGSIGMDVMNDFEYSLNSLEGMRGFTKNHNLREQAVYITSRLNALGIDGLEITDSTRLIEQLNEFVIDRYGSETGAISVRTLNKAIANKEVGSILDVFSDVGKDYMRDVGTYAEILRYPLFRSQPMARLILDSTLEGNQLRASSPILSLLSNVDFDGDTQFIMALTNGMSVLHADDERFQRQNFIFRRFGRDEIRGLTAEALRSGDAITKDNLNNINLERAMALKMSHSDWYEEGVSKWMTDNGITGAVSDLSEAQLKAAHSSSQMSQIFKKYGFNSVTDENMMIASMASRFRKLNIGAVSTPNYTLRNALLSNMNNPDLTDAQRMLLNDTYYDVSNMLSKAGGLFSSTEQKAIDVKHAQDGLLVARTMRYSSGMSRLFQAKNIDDTARGLFDMVSSVGPSVFGTSDMAEINRMVGIVLNNSMDSFKRAEAELVAFNKTTALADAAGQIYSPKDINTLRSLKGLRGLVDIHETIPTFNYRSALDNGTMDVELYDAIADIINTSDKDALARKYKNTAYYNFIDSVAGIRSAPKTTFEKNNLYFKSGSLSSLDDKAFVYEGTKRGQHVFREVDINTGKIIGPKVHHSEDFFDKVKTYNIHDYSKSSTTIAEAKKSVRASKIRKSLDELTFNRRGEIRKSLPSSFFINKSDKAIKRYGEDTWNIVDSLFNGTRDIYDTSQIAPQYEQINQMAKAYDRAVSDGRLRGDAPDNSGEMLRQINTYIAENYGEYGSMGNAGFSANQDYTQIVRSQLSSYMGGESVLDSYIDEVNALPHFNTQEYDEALDFLNKNSYDIMSEEARLNQLYQSIDEDIKGLRKQGANDEELKPLLDIYNRRGTMNTYVQSMRANNKDVMQRTQRKVYGLLGNDRRQLDAFFKFGSAQQDSIRVGFGEYIGTTFDRLSNADISSIKASAEKLIRTDADTLEVYAARKTMESLKNYNPTSGTSALNFKAISKGIDSLEQSIGDARTTVMNSINGRTAERMKQAAEAAAKAKQMNKQTLGGSIADSVKGFDMSKIPMKGIAIGTAALAALGIVNNLLHNEKKGSPLSPKRTDNRDEPNYDNGYKQAPFSRGQTIYADNSSGIQFKVSAKTQNYISAQHNAQLIGMSGAGTAQTHSSYDNSGVTDNWLANKFAELT